MLPLGWPVLCHSLNLDVRAKAPRAPVPEAVRAHGPVMAVAAHPGAQVRRAVAVLEGRVRVAVAVRRVKVAAPAQTRPAGAHVQPGVVMGRPGRVRAVVETMCLVRARPGGVLVRPVRVGRPKELETIETIETIETMPARGVPRALDPGRQVLRAGARVVRRVAGPEAPDVVATTVSGAIPLVGTTSAAQGLLGATGRLRVNDRDVAALRVRALARRPDDDQALTIVARGTGSPHVGRALLGGS